MNNPRPLVSIALCSALLGLLSQCSLPLPAGVPLTLQTFAVALFGCFLGGGGGCCCVLVWLLLGAAGLPVFSGVQGGVAVLFGPTGGFLWGFLLLALFCGMGNSPHKGRASFLRYALCGAFGLILCHGLGVGWFAFVTHQPLWTAALAVSVPYLLKDILSLILARSACALLWRRRSGR